MATTDLAVACHGVRKHFGSLVVLEGIVAVEVVGGRVVVVVDVVGLVEVVGA